MSSSSSVQNSVTRSMPSDQTSTLKVNSSRRTAINALAVVIFAAMIACGIIAVYGALQVGHRGIEALNFVGKVISENPIPFTAGFVTALGAALAYTLLTKKSESSNLASIATSTKTEPNSSTTSSSNVTPVIPTQQAVSTPAIVVQGSTIVEAPSASIGSTTSAPTTSMSSSASLSNVAPVVPTQQTVPTPIIVAQDSTIGATSSSIGSTTSVPTTSMSSSASLSNVTPVVSTQQTVPMPTIVVQGPTIGTPSSSIEGFTTSASTTSMPSSNITNESTTSTNTKIRNIQQLPTSLGIAAAISGHRLGTIVNASRQQLSAAVIATTAVGTTLSTGPIPTSVVTPAVPATLSFLDPAWRNTDRDSDSIEGFLVKGGRILADKEFAFAPMRNTEDVLLYVRSDKFYRFRIPIDQKEGIERDLDKAGFKWNAPIKQTPSSSTASSSSSGTTTSSKNGTN